MRHSLPNNGTTEGKDRRNKISAVRSLRRLEAGAPERQSRFINENIQHDASMKTPLLQNLRKLLALCLISVCTTAASAAPSHPWAAMAQSDADFATDWIMKQSISAVYPAQGAFAARLAAARNVLDADASRVTSFEGYRQALGRFAASLQDEHLRVQFSLAPATYQWPGFIAVYHGGRYLAVSAQGHDAAGQEITHCDGKPMADWVDRVASHEQFAAGLESTKAKAAPLVLRDAGSPFVTRPGSCRIGGQDLALDWQAVSAARFRADMLAATVLHDRIAAITPFGADGAWVRIGFFQPQTPAEGKAFKRLIADAPGLRDKSIIVFDVRGNGGGSYGWFMGLLRALYGKDYADYHARARLQISNVFRTTPAILDYLKDDTDAETGDLVPPADGAMFDKDNAKYRRALAAGNPLFITPVDAWGIPKPKQAPAKLVKARVFVLTDYYCASACIAFVDELKRFPGLEQIGVETGVDSRTGTSFGAPLPSGNGVINVPVMTRDGRVRGDNVPQRPDHVFNGNIVDTAAVKAWVIKQLVGQ